MEVDQITSLVSIFSFGQQVFSNSDQAQTQSSVKKNSSKDEDDSDSDSDTSSDSGHSSDDAINDEKNESIQSLDCSSGSVTRSDTDSLQTSCLAQAKDKDLEVSSVSVAATV